MAVTVEGGIDRAWLEQAAATDPVRHVFAVWDLEHAPALVDFVSLRIEGTTRAYLLIWKGRPLVPVVSWVGEPHPALLEALPSRPLIASVPIAMGAAVADRRGPASTAIVWLMDRPLAGPPLGDGGAGQHLAEVDAPALRDLARENPDPLTEPYGSMDLGAIPVFGVVQRGRVLAVARAQATTDRAWMIGGVYTVPSERGRGYGGDATRAAIAAASEVGARPALFVLEQNLPARRIYERLGFRVVERRVLVDASGAPGTPARVPNGS